MTAIEQRTTRMSEYVARALNGHVFFKRQESQREPGFQVNVRLPSGVSLRTSSSDSFEMAVARMEGTLDAIRFTKDDRYFLMPPDGFRTAA